MSNPVAIIKFENIGSLEVSLFMDVENSTANFVSLANSGYYNGLTMHRIVSDFVAQGGCPDGTGTGGPGYSIDGEFPSNGFSNPHTHKKGSIAWARSMARNSAGSQFYLTLADTPFLDNDYAVFGEVINGMEILDQLNNLGSGSGTPTQKVIIESVNIELNGCDVPDVKKV